MKNIFFIGAFCFCLGNLFGQSEPHYSHFMYNQLPINAAFAGSRDAIHLTGLYRNQWLGIEGAPENISFNFDTPLFNNRQGLGLSLVSDKIGWSNRYSADISYAYRIQLTDKGKLAIGIKGKLDYHRLSWNEADPFDNEDGLVPLLNETSLKPNFGIGALYKTDKFYVGLSAPTLLRTSLYSQKVGEDISYRNKTSYYLSAGAMFGKGRTIKFYPNLLATLNASAPFELELNATFIFADKVWLGLSSRLGDSIDALIGYQLTRQLRASAAVDFTTSKLRDKTFGSVELMVEYTLKCCGKKLNNIRFF